MDKEIKEGDSLILYLDRINYFLVTLEKEKIIHSKFGSFAHKDLIGKKLGEKIQSKKGFAYLLKID